MSVHGDVLHLPDFNRLSSVLFDLAKFDLLNVSSLDHTVPPGFTVPCHSVGHNAPLVSPKSRLFIANLIIIVHAPKLFQISVKNSSHRSDFVSRLQRLLKKYEERSEQFRRKAEKYEAIVLRDKQEGKVKPHIIDKNEKKARQARGVVNGALEEVARIRVLLEEMST
ncbi:hypothetical protein COOONC_10894 [Cooperia oncophora]